jgi:hypothetical protein
MDEFNYGCVEIDREVLYQDFDDIDLYGTKMEETSNSETDIEFE